MNKWISDFVSSFVFILFSCADFHYLSCTGENLQLPKNEGNNSSCLSLRPFDDYHLLWCSEEETVSEWWTADRPSAGGNSDSRWWKALHWLWWPCLPQKLVSQLLNKVGSALFKQSWLNHWMETCPIIIDPETGTYVRLSLHIDKWRQNIVIIFLNKLYISTCLL